VFAKRQRHARPSSKTGFLQLGQAGASPLSEAGCSAGNLLRSSKISPFWGEGWLPAHSPGVDLCNTFAARFLLRFAPPVLTLVGQTWLLVKSRVQVLEQFCLRDSTSRFPEPDRSCQLTSTQVMDEVRGRNQTPQVRTFVPATTSTPSGSCRSSRYYAVSAALALVLHGDGESREENAGWQLKKHSGARASLGAWWCVRCPSLAPSRRKLPGGVEAAFVNSAE
jgi:hypothetical protein